MTHLQGELIAIARQAQRVRFLQRAYFKTRDSDVLIESKREERRLDAMLEALPAELFDEGGRA